MASLEVLRAAGWHLTSEGLAKLLENESFRDIKSITRKALDIDLREIGTPTIVSEINKDVFGPVILQIVKLRNISASKAKPNSQTAPRMLKLSLTDGHTNCPAIELRQIPALNLENTPPGTKILIDGANVISGCIMLDLKCCKILGGIVPSLVDRWEISKLMPSHIRVTEDGPPAWVNFGKKIVTNLNNQNFKSLKNKNKENTKEDAEFLNQRQDAISEAAQGAVKKVFGGGVKIPETFKNAPYTNNDIPSQNMGNFGANGGKREPNGANNRASKGARKGREKLEGDKVEKPSQRVSLFDFLEDKLPVSELPKNTEQPRENINKPKNKYTERRNYEKEYDNIRNTNQNKFQNKYTEKREERNTEKYQKNDYKSSNDRKEYDFRNERFQQDKPPRFQRQRNENSKFSQNNYESKNENVNKYSQNENRTKPDTNNVINKLTNEMNNISLYNSKYENEKLHQKSSENYGNKNWIWNIGDRCMAKYWEDNKFYNAIVTGITNKTCLVEFIEYGNFEEVLHCDCIPVTSEKEQPQKQISENQQFSGNLEFRRGKSRPFVRNQNKPYQGNRNYES